MNTSSQMSELSAIAHHLNSSLRYGEELAERDASIDAEDIIQSNILALLRACQTLDMQRSTDEQSMYMYTSMFNRVKNLRRYYDRRPEIVPLPPFLIEKIIEENQDQRELLDQGEGRSLALTKLLEACKEKERAVLLRRYFMRGTELTPLKAIATDLGIEENHVKQLIFRGLKRIRESEEGSVFKEEYVNVG